MISPKKKPGVTREINEAAISFEMEKKAGYLEQKADQCIRFRLPLVRGANAHSSLDSSTSFGMPYLLFPPTGPLPISQQIPSNRYNRHPQGSSSQSVSVENVVPLGVSSASFISSANVAEKIPSVIPIAGISGNPPLTGFTILLTQMTQAFLPPSYPSRIAPFFSPSGLFHRTNHSSFSTFSALSSYSSTSSSHPPNGGNFLSSSQKTSHQARDQTDKNIQKPSAFCCLSSSAASEYKSINNNYYNNCNNNNISNKQISSTEMSKGKETEADGNANTHIISINTAQSSHDL
ncbi:uncharacterized protein MONOS_948 [Monocercomonoides exilis]|uniref:uncharacterized protein n=1 Tax=Monocercomonoides exilis TaxID=2049356 RepID=UPI00355A92A0|nr:hypothetical protein MONOS_948 [Monocercomonoides exilis]|eukprot:MONOS_948.1-p1 / transcript=MONOS_948.1 / gene=MONOS_948 / organism=Monocercomonoides_exilis_PA203 / gene_product=unspecified product / transcript_product=unspecified product / location=Mono_scaffold00015:238162-239416(+) / protein_length=291 / sequence_SO=supercontig / SO=protein_coding / is_pseudo=false